MRERNREPGRKERLLLSELTSLERELETL